MIYLQGIFPWTYSITWWTEETAGTPFLFFPRWVDREVKIYKMKQAAKKKAEKMTGALAGQQ